MEATQTLEKTGEKVKKVKFEDFDPKDAQDYLPGWKVGAFALNVYQSEDLEEIPRQEGWRFAKTFQDGKWSIAVYSKIKGVRWVQLEGPNFYHLTMDSVKEIEFDPRQRHLAFLTEKNKGYYIANQGKDHNFRDKRISFSFRLKEVE